MPLLTRNRGAGITPASATLTPASATPTVTMAMISGVMLPPNQSVNLLRLRSQTRSSLYSPRHSNSGWSYVGPPAEYKTSCFGNTREPSFSSGCCGDWPGDHFRSRDSEGDCLEMRLPLHAHWSHGISAALLGVLILLPATPASAQSRDDFAYWDANGNGDLTCAEADEGLRLPAYQDNRDGTGLIYEWLERSRSSDGNNDGVACENSSNPDGYIPNVTVDPPPQPRPDLVVPGPNVSETSVETGETFWFIATVTNDGDAQSQSAATTVRYLRSTDATITESDTEEGTDEVRALLLNQGYAATIRLTAPSTAGTYYYGACVDAVAGESDTTNNCSASVQVDVSEPQVEPPVVEPPVETLTCSADAETWRGLQVCDERPRDGYDRDAFGTGYSSLEDEIIAALPPTMKANEQVYTPYSCLAFDITAAGTAATDIEHIVALAETHDSGIADDRRRDIASDLDNLTIADPTVNRSQKSDRDAAEWMPARHGAWFAEQVIQVKLEYGLSIDPAERDALEALLAGGGAQLNCVDAIAPTPTMLTLSTTSAPAEGGNPVTVTATLDNPAPANGLTVTLTTSGTATLDTDYTLSSTTITLAEGETAGTVTITVTDDAEDDDGETIVIDAESTSPALTADQLTLTIEDNDGPLPTMLTLSADPARPRAASR